jgi:hypothetical protein
VTVAIPNLVLSNASPELDVLFLSVTTITDHSVVMSASYHNFLGI